MRIKSFDLPPGTVFAGKYRIISRLGSGWEGEVYKIQETSTGVERAAKFFFPQRNERKKASKFYAKKLHKLRRCSILIQYHTEETVSFNGLPVTALISEYVEGMLLSTFIKRFQGNRLTPFQGIHLLYALAKGLEDIHLMNEYHGDLHADNIIVNHFGLEFDLKVLDLFRWADPKNINKRDDICNLIRVFYESIGGKKRYPTQPDIIKHICCGLKRSLILNRFRTMSELREFLESMEWTDSDKG